MADVSSMSSGYGGPQGDLMNWPFVVVMLLALGKVFKEIGVLRLELLQCESRDQR